jgi:acyl dehydratase
MHEIEDVAALQSSLDRELAVSTWVDVTQADIERFADAIGDRQWIHVDAARAARESPFGTTIAHGFLVLSLLSELFRRAMTVKDVQLAVNYGLNRVRFVAPVPSGSRIRGRFTPVAIETFDRATQVTWKVVVEREHGDKPCCVAEWLIRYYCR